MYQNSYIDGTKSKDNQVVRYVPDCNFLWIIDKKVRMIIKIRNKECHDYVDCEESIDNVIDDQQCRMLIR